MEKKNIYQTVAKLGLIKFSQQQSFTHRNGAGGRNFIVDTRGTGENPILRKMVVDTLSETLYTLPECEVIGGVANSGTQWAALIAYKLGMPFCNILKEPRKSGMKRQIEGSIEGKRIVLVDDWMNTGNSILNAIEIAITHGGFPVGLLLISGYESVQHKFDIPHAFAFSTRLLIKAAADQKLISTKLKNELLTIKK